jgi:hypothetical protein
MICEGMTAGLGGAAAMSISTNLAMQLRGSPPSAAPATSLERLLGIELENERIEHALLATSHFAISVAVLERDRRD